MRRSLGGLAQPSESAVLISYVGLCAFGLACFGPSLETVTALSALGVSIGGVAASLSMAKALRDRR